MQDFLNAVCDVLSAICAVTNGSWDVPDGSQEDAASEVANFGQLRLDQVHHNNQIHHSSDNGRTVAADEAHRYKKDYLFWAIRNPVKYLPIYESSLLRWATRQSLLSSFQEPPRTT